MSAPASGQSLLRSRRISKESYQAVRGNHNQTEFFRVPLASSGTRDYVTGADMQHADPVQWRAQPRSSTPWIWRNDRGQLFIGLEGSPEENRVQRYVMQDFLAQSKDFYGNPVGKSVGRALDAARSLLDEWGRTPSWAGASRRPILWRNCTTSCASRARACVPG